jgi:hypothetical protein
MCQARATVAIFRRPREVRTRSPIACKGFASALRQRFISTWATCTRVAALVIAAVR